VPHFSSHLGLVVSGGNTLLVKLDTDLKISIIARTVDDAAGEAFDKGAKLLGLPYPGGALIEQLAQKGNHQSFHFPRGLPDKSDLRFSFSGLKTALRYQLEKMSDEEVKSQLPSICASYQDAILGQLNAKMLSALNSESYKSVGLSGGVANNRALRTLLAQSLEKRKLPLLVAEPKYCGDNAGYDCFRCLG
jgi:N6-L-threonylcarbamoyladenine synthase